MYEYMYYSQLGHMSHMYCYKCTNTSKWSYHKAQPVYFVNICTQLPYTHKLYIPWYHIIICIHAHIFTHTYTWIHTLPTYTCAHTQTAHRHRQTNHRQTDGQTDRQTDRQIINSPVNKHTQLTDLISYNYCLVWISLSYHLPHRMPLSIQTTKQNTSTQYY